MDTLIKLLVQANIDPERIIPRAVMARYTTFHIGGPADVLVNIASPSEIPLVLRAAKLADAPVTLMGNGSNTLVRDGGIRGLVIRIDGSMADIRREGDTVYAQSGALLRSVANFAMSEGLTGMEEVAGIPGTIGGGVIMNAGAYGGEMAQIVTHVDAIALSDRKPVSFEGDALGFGYRRSAMMHADVVVTEVTMQLRPGDPAQIKARMDELAKARREKQPLEYPSAGSFFKRPEGHFAGALIEQCGLKGLTVGGAQVSEKHAGFLINRGGATCADVLRLSDEVTQRVKEAFGVSLEREVQLVGR